MNGALAHRGPDGAGEFCDDSVLLAMRRLSIIDLQGAWQPLYNEDRSIVLVANGEIYNFVELRQELERRGHRFTTHGDCETILHLYEEFGVDCVKHLRGMVAFALWDSRKRRLILGRDRMGEKPLYLWQTDDRLVFASELKSLLQNSDIPFELEPSAVHYYLHYQLVPEPLTPVTGVRKLGAAHVLVVDVDSWRISESRYWSAEDAPLLEGDPARLIRNQLEEISQLLVRSDVPVGIALSGGMDSSAIAALTSRAYPSVMHAFSVGYEDVPASDERKDARRFAEYLNMPFHEVALSTRDMVASFPEVVYWRDDPIADIAGFGHYSVVQLARQHNVPVLLQGQGGDELFWGYGWLRQALKESIQKQTDLRRGSLAVLARCFTPSLPDGLSRPELRAWAREGLGLRRGVRRWRHKSAPPGQLVFYDLISEYRAAQHLRDRIYTAEFAARVREVDPAGLFTFPDPGSSVDLRLTRLILDTYLLENGLAQGDRLSMAHGVELRLPLVDYRLVETVIGLRKRYPERSPSSKEWLRGALRDLLPDWVLSRPKRGFTPPTRAWRRALFAEYGSWLTDGVLISSKIVDPSWPHTLSRDTLLDHQFSKMNFALLVLETWCRRITASPAPQSHR